MKTIKNQARLEIKQFFGNLKCKSPKEVKKIRRLAMKHNIKLGTLRKKFCKKCFSTDLKIKSVKNKTKTVQCKDCKNIMRWKIK